MPVKLAFPIVTLVVETGIPAVQFPALFQLVLTFPVQLVCEKLLLRKDKSVKNNTLSSIDFFIVDWIVMQLAETNYLLQPLPASNGMRAFLVSH